MAAARDEAEMVLFNSVAHVLEEARLKPGQVISLAKVHECVAGLCCCSHCAQRRSALHSAHATLIWQLEGLKEGGSHRTEASHHTGTSHLGAHDALQAQCAAMMKFF